MEKQIPLLVTFFAFFWTLGIAQSAIVSVGGDAQSGNSSVSYTVGQIAVQTSENSNGVSVGEGVQQPYEIMIVGVDDYPQISLRAVVYPNPTSTIVNVQFIMNNVQLEDAGMQVLDMYGKLVKVIPITGETTSINVSDLADGVYFVRLRTDAGTVTKRFVKN